MIFFCCMSNIEDFTASLKRRQLLQNKTEWHIPTFLEGYFLGIRREVELHQQEVTFFITFTRRFLYFCHVFTFFNVF